MASTIPKEVNVTPGRTLGKCHLATGASHEKTPRARGALRGRGRALACPSTPTHVPVFLKFRVRSVFLHKTSLKAAWRLLQLCIAALAGRCLALGGLQPRTNSGALTRTRRRRSSCALCSYLRVASTITQRLTPHQEERWASATLPLGPHRKKHPEHAARCVGVGVPWHARAPKPTCPCV